MSSLFGGLLRVGVRIKRLADARAAFAPYVHERCSAAPLPRRRSAVRARRMK